MSKHYHLIGIGGIGMSGIARLFLRRGIKISGSDLKETRATQELKKLGARVFIGHDSKNTQGAQVVIYSSAIRQDNPEIIKARKSGIPLLKRAQALAGLMKDKTVITVSGAHGKTTTASLTAHLLLEVGLQPTIAIGGILRNIGTNASLGDGDFFVAEADESDGSFLFYRPMYSIITNIDHEHLDYYKNFQNVVASFKKFAARTQKDGCVFGCYDDLILTNMLKEYKNRYLLFGLKKGADIYPKNIVIRGLSSEFDGYFKNKFIDRFHLALGGMHNISNALSVIALGLVLKIELKVIKNALASYKGAGRRLEIKFHNQDCLVIDDYAHHPTEIRATLSALKNLKSRRIIAVFQPHRYTRTKLLLDEFSRSFDLADYVIITDIYPAGELPIEGINGRRLQEKIKERTLNKNILFLPKEKILEHILKIKKPGDLIITLGAGDIVKACDELVERIKRES